MKQSAALELAPIVEAAYRAFEGDARRWRDLDIAEWLGLERTRDIRAVIERNQAELERHGPLRFETALAERPQGGGSAATEYWLNFEQSMVICTQSRTRRAQDVRTVMIRVFSKVVSGEVATMPRMEIRALEVAADRIVAPILKEQREFHGEILSRMDRHENEIATVKQDFATVRQDITELRREHSSRRREFTREVRRTYIEVVIHYYNARCPSCRTSVLIENDMCGGEIDHWFGPWKNKLRDGWLVCRPCNEGFNDSEFKGSKSGAFSMFQENLRLHLKSARGQTAFDF